MFHPKSVKKEKGSATRGAQGFAIWRNLLIFANKMMKRMIL